MKSLLGRFSIAARLGLLAGLGLSAVVIFAGLYGFANHRINQALNQQHRMEQLAELAQSLRNHAQSMRLNSERFLQSNDRTYANIAQDHHAKALEKVSRISPDIWEQAEILNASLYQMGHHFNQLFQQMERLGLSDDLGLRGALANSVKAMEDELKLWPNAEPLMLDMLRMREAERMFMLYGQSQYLGHHNRFARQFDFALDGTTLPPSSRADFRKLLGVYTADMQAFAENHLLVTQSTANLRQHQEQMMPIFAQLVDFAAHGKAQALIRQQDVRRMADNAITLTGLLGLALFLGTALLIGRSIITPVRQMEQAMRRIAEGDTVQPIPALDRQDEIGDMAQAVLIFKTNAEQVLALQAQHQRVHQEAEAASRAQMLHLAQKFETAVQNVAAQISLKAQHIHEAAGQMAGSENDQDQAWSLTIAEAAEQARNLVQEMAGAAEQFNQSVHSVAIHAQDVGGTAEQAVQKLAQAEGRVNALMEMNATIDQIVGLIGDIAERTNMLSLNATIEASRAGEAGKGFAVVANEVKRLALQTAQATREIATQVHAIQNVTHETVEAISNVGQSIRDMDRLAQSVQITVAEQIQVACEIKRCVMDVTQNTHTLSNGVTNFTHSTANQCGAAAKVIWAAEDLAAPTATLTKELESFLVTIRAS